MLEVMIQQLLETINNSGIKIESTIQTCRISYSNSFVCDAQVELGLPGYGESLVRLAAVPGAWQVFFFLLIGVTDWKACIRLFFKFIFWLWRFCLEMRTC